jgi:tetraacyldisaccharide 4'-kinase
MRAPAFWWQPAGWQSAALAPLGWLYGAVAARRLHQTGQRAGVPVLCIGNFTAGGAGKTPTAIAVAALARELGHRPAFLLRGYGGRLAGPVLVERRHTAAEVGDEALLLARHRPTIVARDRPAGAALAMREGASLIIMDDGLQNPSLHKDASLAVVDAGVGIGNGACLPAGPLRAPMAAQAPLVMLQVLVGDGAAPPPLPGTPTLRARLEADPVVAAALHGQPVVAFAGIGRPEKFRRTLEHLGARVLAFHPFGDHQTLPPSALAALRDEAARLGALLVTTEKDMARLGQTEGITALPVTLVFDDNGPLRALIAALGRA